MQGKKIYQEKLFNSFQLSDRIPKENFHRRLLAVLDLTYLYELTKRYYGSSGQKSIDPVVFILEFIVKAKKKNILKSAKNALFF
jgi:hypothetical protein